MIGILLISFDCVLSLLVWSGPGGPAAWRRSPVASSSSWAGRTAAWPPCWGSSPRWKGPPAPSASPRGRARSAARPGARRGARPCRQKKFGVATKPIEKVQTQRKSEETDRHGGVENRCVWLLQLHDRICLHCSSPPLPPSPPPHFNCCVVVCFKLEQKVTRKWKTSAGEETEKSGV